MGSKCAIAFLLAACFLGGHEAAVPLLMSWTSSIKLIENHDSSEATVTAITPSTTHAIGIDFHYRRNELYFSDALGRIYRSRLNGDNVTDPIVILEVRLTDGLAVDWAHDNLYWTDISSKTVETATLDGASRRVLFSVEDGVDKPRGIVVDPAQGLLFWTDWGAKAKVESSGLDGKEKRTIVSTNLLWPNGIAADLDREKLYILDGLRSELYSCDYDGSNFKTIQKSILNMLQSFAITYSNNKVYWGTWASHTLFSYNIYSKATASVLKRSDGLRMVKERMMGLKAMDGSLQPLESAPDPCSTAGCAHTCLVGRNRQSSCFCNFGYTLNNDGKTCTEEGYLLVSWRKTIRRYNLNMNSSSQQPLLDGTTAAISISFHLKKGLIFWSDIEEHRIYSAPLEQLNNKTVVASPETCDGLAVDWVHDLLYWTDTDRNTIHVAQLDGTNQTALIYDHLDQPRDIAVDPITGLMFWTDWGSNPKIERAVLDGSNRRTIVSADLAWPNGITLDMDRKIIYWVDGKLSTISSCTYEGSNKEIILSPQQFSEQPFSISFFKNNVYWTDWKSQSTYKADTTSMVTSTRMANSSTIFLPHEMNICAQMKCNGLCLGRMQQNGLPQARCSSHTVKEHEDPDIVFEEDNPKCMTDELICNAKKDCPDGSDEDLTLCAAIESAIIYKKNNSEIFLRVSVSNRTKKQLKKFVGDYRITSSENSTNFERPLMPCIMWPESYCLNISSLSKNKKYNFSVSAHLKGGQVGKSILLSTRTTEGIPGAPENVRVASYTSKSVELQWTHPTEANGIIRSFTVNIQELETFDEDVCCQNFPELNTPVSSEEPVYGVEIAGLLPASTYGVLIASKTLFLGTSNEIQVNTPPPPLRMLHEPPDVRTTSEKLIWMNNTITDEINTSGKYDHLIRSYLLLIIPINESDHPVRTRSDLEELQPILEANFGTKFIVMLQKKVDNIYELEPLEWPIDKIEYKAVWVQVSEHKGSYSLDIMESKPFKTDHLYYRN